MCGARPGGAERGRKSERDRTLRTYSHTANKRLGVDALELTLEKAVELGVPRRGLAVLHGLRRGRVPRLLHEDLGELDHGRVVVELVREVNHVVSGVLLFAWPGGGEERREGGHGEWVALLASAGCELGEAKKQSVREILDFKLETKPVRGGTSSVHVEERVLLRKVVIDGMFNFAAETRTRKVPRKNEGGALLALAHPRAALLRVLM